MQQHTPHPLARTVGLTLYERLQAIDAAKEELVSLKDDFPRIHEEIADELRRKHLPPSVAKYITIEKDSRTLRIEWATPKLESLARHTLLSYGDNKFGRLLIEGGSLLFEYQRLAEETQGWKVLIPQRKNPAHYRSVLELGLLVETSTLQRKGMFSANNTLSHAALLTGVLYAVRHLPGMEASSPLLGHALAVAGTGVLTGSEYFSRKDHRLEGEAQALYLQNRRNELLCT